MVHILVDVAWEDEHIEECEQRTDECFLFPKEQHAKAEGSFLRVLVNDGREKGGTFYTIRKAMAQNIPIVNVF